MPRTKSILTTLTLILMLSLLASCGGTDGNNDIGTVLPPTVITRSGAVSGIVQNGISAYLGIPFAAPPVGDRRWRLPEKEASWTDVFQADQLSPACPQGISPGDLYGLTECHEDCLYLNVWTPNASDSKKLPVMFWVHGGGFMYGSASMAVYNGAKMAQKGVVIVTTNYRLGPLGFMVHQDLYDSQGQAGNYGLHDVVAALEWVRENIAAFGGDPDNVTVFGESAGSCIITLLQNAPLAAGLYAKAIAQSGTMPSLKYVENLTGSWLEAAGNGQRLQTVLGASDIEEMRAMSAETIIDAGLSNEISFGPVMDGVFLSDDPRSSALQLYNAPMIIGTVEDEGSLFIYESGIRTLAEYEAAIGIWFGTNAGIVRDLFPASNDNEAIGQAIIVNGLSGMQEPARYVARAASTSVPVYRYYYRHVPPTEAGLYLGCWHGSELEYVFGNLDSEEGFGPEDTAFSDQIMDLWTSFAKTGIPSAEGLPEWPEFVLGQEAIFNMNGPGDFNVTNGSPLDQGCDFFESIAPFVAPDYPF